MFDKHMPIDMGRTLGQIKTDELAFGAIAVQTHNQIASAPFRTEGQRVESIATILSDTHLHALDVHRLSAFVEKVPVLQTRVLADHNFKSRVLEGLRCIMARE